MQKKFMTKKNRRWFSQRWVLAMGGIIALLNLYSFSPGYGQSATPTPNIGTVPDFIFTPTPTPADTPVPSATPLPAAPTATRTAPSAPANNGGNDNNNSAPSAPAAPVSTNPPALQAGNEITLTAVVTVTTLNMRRGPSDSERVVDTLFLDDEVQVIARNGDGSWWLVCCGNRTGQPGWVNAGFLLPSFERTAALRLVPLAPGLSANTTTTPLQLEMFTTPAQVWQGLNVEIYLVVTNPGNRPVRNVRLRDHLPATLEVQKTSADVNAVVRQQNAEGGSTIVSATWPQIAAGGQVTLTLAVQVDATLADGEMIDNLAIVNVNGGADVTAGLTLAMPPALLPKFR